MQRGIPNADRAQTADVASGRREHRADDRRDRGAHLRPPYLPAPRSTATTRPPPSRPPPPPRRACALHLIDLEIRQLEQPAARIEHQLGEVRRPVATHRLERLAHLERIPHRAAERLIHVGEQADRRVPSDSITSASSCASWSVFMNAPSPTFTSSTIACAPAASFFDMIDAAIREIWSTVAVTSLRAVEQLVGRHQIARLTDDRQPVDVDRVFRDYRSLVHVPADGGSWPCHSAAAAASSGSGLRRRGRFPLRRLGLCALPALCARGR